MDIENSARLSYRLLTANDAQLLFELDQDPAVMKYINGGKVHSIEYIKDIYLPRLNKFTNPTQGWGLWGVFMTESKQFIGWILVRPMDFFGDVPQWEELEIGWRFKQETWGKGIGTEAAKQVMDAVVELGVAKCICAIAMEDNIGSIGIMKKLGMKYIKTCSGSVQYGLEFV
jgi:RimJ/RimL family protein N-acetyltransferase